MTEHDALLEVFLSSAKRDLFHSVEHHSRIWREDPFDVESVHDNARVQFNRLLAQATNPPGLDSGRILLLLGDSGSGKTHLVRAFRNHVHSNGLGFVGYLQMTTGITSYSRYLVSNLIDSLDQAYYESAGTASGLLRLSNAIASRSGDPEAIRELGEQPNLTMTEVAELVERAADRLISHPRYADLDLDLVRALLFLQRQDPVLKTRVVRYLRCEELGPRDRRYLGDISPRVGEEDAQRRVEQIGRLIAALDNRALVLCVDQFEDAYLPEDAEGQFRRVTSSLCAVADHVPSSLIVIACLRDYYTRLKTRISRSTLDRLEKDPQPVALVSERSPIEVERVIAQRLGYLYETAGVKREQGAVDFLHPFPREFVRRLDGLRVRDVLDECQRFREACIDAGRIVAVSELPAPEPQPLSNADTLPQKSSKEKLERDWNDYLAQYSGSQPDSDAEIIKLFGWAIETCAEGLERGHRFEVVAKKETLEIRVMVPIGNGDFRVGEEIYLAICNRGAQGTGLLRQIDAARKQAKQRVLAILRCDEFPKNRRTVTWQKVDELREKGGRTAVLEHSDLRKIAAYRAFCNEAGPLPHFAAWAKDGKHLAKILAIIHVLDLDQLHRFDAAVAPRASVVPAPPPSTPPSRRR